jgi:hypothetical protein
MFCNYILISCRLGDNQQKHGRTMQATDGDTALVLCMLDVQATDAYSEYEILHSI